MHRRNLSEAIERYHLRYPQEIEAVQRFRKLLAEYPNCFERTCWAGHITGSAWLVDASGEQLLLTNHRKLKMWLQLGGHSDGDANTSGVAYREAVEESGLKVALLSEEIFDIDIDMTPSLLRGFSAPVILKTDITMSEYLHILKYDTDAFNKWDAIQNLYLDSLSINFSRIAFPSVIS